MILHTVATPHGQRDFQYQTQRDEFLDYLGVAFADVTSGSLDGLAGTAVTNGVDINWGARSVHPTPVS